MTKLKALAIPSTWLIIPCIPSVKSKAFSFPIDTYLYIFLNFIYPQDNK